MNKKFGARMEDKNRFSFISTQGFAERLRRRRLGLGLRKQDLAAQVGVSLTTIQQYENGQLPKGSLPSGWGRPCAVRWTGCWPGRGMWKGPCRTSGPGWSWCPWWRRVFPPVRGASRPAAMWCGTMPSARIFCGCKGSRRTWLCCGSPATAGAPHLPQ